MRAQVRPGGLQRRGRGQPLEVDLSRCGCR
eukprot:COSAG01_NODE_34752_length_542_cov_3.812641_2_plen_29_part_01